MIGWLRAILEGMASILDIGGTLQPERRVMTPEEALRTDRVAIASDWRAVGDDLRWAMGKMMEEIDETTR